ncbi:hypothetical protein HMPREF9103_00978 [Lentilactobacillus parafarraginis F0439]|uniref:Uncharacterized protein n=1 Tax=Lentilactobacillus parafarraginis F0439 TaxID=797515 RepID=G9ZMM8_9LACO|nr:hypothetical protein HMPREF9103_00978 [Lentilactobacillus parafarraginis F0439]
MSNSANSAGLLFLFLLLTNVNFSDKIKTIKVYECKFKVETGMGS